MRTHQLASALLCSISVAVIACDRPEREPLAPDARVPSPALRDYFANSEWSAPVNLGTPINSSAFDQNAAFSPDDMSLYFVSTRAGGLGNTDLWVAHRACDHCPWETPVNLGAALNSASAEAAPRLSNDGHLLFFTSDRPGGHGSIDIYLSRRDNPNDDFGWSDPVNLGPDVNTAASEAGPDYLPTAEDGAANFYFIRGAPVGALYYASITRNGETRGPAVLVPELSDPVTGPGHPSVRKDGKEIFFQSSRAGGLGGSDLWTSTRSDVHQGWSPPVNMGAPLNTTFTDFQPTISHDGRTLIFTSNRPGGSGLNDLWVSTRTPSGR